MKMEEVFTLSQVARHNLKQDCWLVIDGKVFDVTKFLEEHPGGEDVLIEYSGTDATKAFEDIGHSKEAKNLLLKYRVGHLPGFDFLVTKFTNDELPFQKEMKAFVIKEDSQDEENSVGGIICATLSCCLLPKLSLFLLGNLILLFHYK